MVDGDPTADITLLQDAAKIVAVMKSGEFYHNALTGQVKHYLPVREPVSLAADQPVVGD